MVTMMLRRGNAASKATTRMRGNNDDAFDRSCQRGRLAVLQPVTGCAMEGNCCCCERQRLYYEGQPVELQAALALW